MEDTIAREETEFPYYDLKVADRCDKCGAQAFMVAHREIDGKDYILLFCGHHGRENLPVLGIQGWSIQDEISKINTKPTEVSPEHF